MTLLQRYNQILFALVGTLLLLGAAILMVYAAYSSLRTARNPNNQILDEAQLETDREKGIRRQKVIFVPHQNYLNTANWSWSVFEVQIKTLNKPENSHA